MTPASKTAATGDRDALVIIAASTRFGERFCIGGYEIRPPQGLTGIPQLVPVRLMTTDGQNQPADTPLDEGDLIRARIRARPDPVLPHTEDVLVSSFARVTEAPELPGCTFPDAPPNSGASAPGTLDFHGLMSLAIARGSIGDGHDLFDSQLDRNAYTDRAFSASRDLDRSVEWWIPGTHGPHWLTIETESFGKHREFVTTDVDSVRTRFSYVGRHPICRRILRERLSPSAGGVRRQVALRISLARWWQPQESVADPVCYAQVSAIWVVEPTATPAGITAERVVCPTPRRVGPRGMLQCGCSTERAVITVERSLVTMMQRDARSSAASAWWRRTAGVTVPVTNRAIVGAGALLRPDHELWTTGRPPRTGTEEIVVHDSGEPPPLRWRSGRCELADHEVGVRAGFSFHPGVSLSMDRAALAMVGDSRIAMFRKGSEWEMDGWIDWPALPDHGVLTPDLCGDNLLLGFAGQAPAGTPARSQAFTRRDDGWHPLPASGSGDEWDSGSRTSLGTTGRLSFYFVMQSGHRVVAAEATSGKLDATRSLAIRRQHGRIVGIAVDPSESVMALALDGGSLAVLEFADGTWAPRSLTANVADWSAGRHSLRARNGQVLVVLDWNQTGEFKVFARERKWGELKPASLARDPELFGASAHINGQELVIHGAEGPALAVNISGEAT